jgi:hypothetical protein
MCGITITIIVIFSFAEGRAAGCRLPVVSVSDMVSDRNSSGREQQTVTESVTVSDSQ